MRFQGRPDEQQARGPRTKALSLAGPRPLAAHISALATTSYAANSPTAHARSGHAGARITRTCGTVTLSIAQAARRSRARRGGAICSSRPDSRDRVDRVSVSRRLQPPWTESRGACPHAIDSAVHFAR